MFADEARFGRINCPRPCWAPTGLRPKVASQLIREFTYLYGAVSPKDGACCYLIMPAADTECCRVGEDVAILTPHSAGRAEFPHPVPHERASFHLAYRWMILANGSGWRARNALKLAHRSILPRVRRSCHLCQILVTW